MFLGNKVTIEILRFFRIFFYGSENKYKLGSCIALYVFVTSIFHVKKKPYQSDYGMIARLESRCVLRR